MGGYDLRSEPVTLAKVTGSDLKSYPPISNQLENLNIEVIPNYEIDQLKLKPDLFVIGNVMSRGMPIIEGILAQNLPYTSGPTYRVSFVPIFLQ